MDHYKTYGPLQNLRTTTKPTDLTLKPTNLTKIVLYTTTDHYVPDPKTCGPQKTCPTHQYKPLLTTTDHYTTYHYGPGPKTYGPHQTCPTHHYLSIFLKMFVKKIVKKVAVRPNTENQSNW